MRIVLALDKFKGSLSAAAAAASVERGIRQVHPDAEIATLLIADGGDGMLDAVCARGFSRVSVPCTGPTGEPVVSGYAIDRAGTTAVVELADACGLLRLPRNAAGVPILAPWDASSRGVGEVIAAALRAEIPRLVVGVGGSASTDGGAGMLVALGARLLDAAGRPIPPGLRGLQQLARLDPTGVLPQIATTELIAACDVTNPLLGPNGAAAIFGPQKGLDVADVSAADKAIAHLADLVEWFHPHRDQRGAGAAGGVGWALLTLGAEIKPGIEVVLDLVGFDEVVAGSDLVVTGEGRLDEQTLAGKAPAGVARRARRLGVPVLTLCGSSTLPAEVADAAGFTSVVSLSDVEPDRARAMRNADDLLTGLAAGAMRTGVGRVR